MRTGSPRHCAKLDSRWATPQRVRWLSKLSTIYGGHGVLADGFAPALQECCPSAPECWARAAQRRQPVIAANCGSGQNASIFWPWVGENYRRGGVCLVTLNLNHAEGDWWAAPA
jgi:hypothetical protein